MKNFEAPLNARPLARRPPLNPPLCSPILDSLLLPPSIWNSLKSRRTVPENCEPIRAVPIKSRPAAVVNEPWLRSQARFFHQKAAWQSQRGDGERELILRLFQVSCSLVACTIERERKADEGRGEDGINQGSEAGEREPCRGGSPSRGVPVLGLASRVVRHVERDSGRFVVWHVEVEPTVPRLSPNYKTNAVHSVIIQLADVPPPSVTAISPSSEASLAPGPFTCPPVFSPRQRCRSVWLRLQSRASDYIALYQRFVIVDVEVLPVACGDTTLVNCGLWREMYFNIFDAQMDDDF